MGQKHTKWTKEKIAAEALKYSMRSKFNKANGSAYQAAVRLGILDEVCVHMVNPPVRESWNPTKVAAKASKHTTRKEFEKEDRKAYVAARRLGILDEVCAHMEPVRESWDRNRVTTEASKYTTRIAFYKGSPKAYGAAHRNRWLEEVCTHMGAVRESWDRDRVAAEAMKYQTRKEFEKGSGRAYRAARRLGILDEVCIHMPKFAGHSDAPTNLYIYLHPEAYAYVGITNDRDTRHKDHKESGRNPESKFLAQDSEPHYFTRFVEYKDTFEPFAIEDRKTAERLERFYIRKLAKDGWKVTNKAHNPQYDNATGKYDWEEKFQIWCDLS